MSTDCTIRLQRYWDQKILVCGKNSFKIIQDNNCFKNLVINIFCDPRAPTITTFTDI